jgi:hypothetical protein
VNEQLRPVSRLAFLAPALRRVVGLLDELPVLLQLKFIVHAGRESREIVEQSACIYLRRHSQVICNVDYPSNTVGVCISVVAPTDAGVKVPGTDGLVAKSISLQPDKNARGACICLVRGEWGNALPVTKPDAFRGKSSSV